MNFLVSGVSATVLECCKFLDGDVISSIFSWCCVHLVNCWEINNGFLEEQNRANAFIQFSFVRCVVRDVHKVK